jgi:hypothetical protein
LMCIRCNNYLTPKIGRIEGALPTRDGSSGLAIVAANDPAAQRFLRRDG